MNGKTSPYTTWALALILCCLMAGAASAAPPTQALAEREALGALQAAAPDASEPLVYLNEIMPRPATGQHQWIELHRSGTPEYHLYLPVVMKDAGGTLAAVAAQPQPP